ncbi:MAG: molybdopterin dehydrogenase, partial [Planctomycetes bacterium]|nr:molybdopterin dehydrogenase [Planctomycetota bacterium]
MRPFEYAKPTTEAEAVQLLSDHDGNTAVLAGGTDLIRLLRRDLITPQRVVDIKHVESMRGIQPDGDGIRIGALTTLEELQESPYTTDYRSLQHVNDGIRAIQIQQNGTLGGDLCHLPNCWYFRNGYGLLARQNGESLVEEGDNRYHAIFGNRGPAKFVSASRFAPPLIAWNAKVRIVGPEPEQAEWLPLE